MDLMQPSAPGEWKRGWTLVLAASAGFSFFSIMTTSMGVFMGALGKEFGWSRTLLSAGSPIAGVVNLLLAPFVGMLVDRWGARRLALPGLAAMIVATCCFGLLNGSPTQWIGLWVFYALTASVGSMTVWSAAVSGAFEQGRGLALGLTLAGTAVAQAVTPPLSSYLIGAFGWRMAYVLLGVLWGGFALLLCLLFFYDRHDRKRLAPATAEAPPDPASLPGLSIAEAWRDRGLWQIGISTFVLMVLTIGFLIHQVPILTAAGVTPEHAAWLAGLGGLAGILGKLVTGVLIDRYRANWVGGVTLGATTLVFAFLLDGLRTPALIVVAILINGYSAGTKLQICTYLTSRYGGLRNFGTIFGFMSILITGGAALGPLLAGLAYDMSGSYAPFLTAGVAGCLLCGFLILTLPPYPDWRTNETGEPATAAG
jgi:MFS family permease